MPTSFRFALYMLLLFGLRPLQGQETQAGRGELAVTFVGQRSLKANTGQDFWMEGGSAELGISLVRGLAVVADATGAHTGSTGPSGVPLDLTMVTLGPRYRWHPLRRLSLYGQVLFGEATGANSLFPTPTGSSEPSARSFALQVGGGVDFPLAHRFAVRALDLGYLRSTLPNGTNNVQNTLRLGAGVVWRFGH
jgi:hypothetical protein